MLQRPVDALRRDRALLYAAAFFRAAAVGMCGVLLAFVLKRRGCGAEAVGLLVSLGLGGGLLATAVAGAAADRWGRRRFLAGLSLLAAAGVAGLAPAPDLTTLIVVCFVGMVNGMGRERGAATAIDQAILPQTTDDAGRTRAFAWYNVCLDAGHAAGALLAGLPAELRDRAGLPSAAADRWSLLVCAALAALPAGIALFLSRGVEPAHGREPVKLSPGARRRVAGLSALFAVDSLGGGFLTSALVSFWFFTRFGVDERSLAWLFFGARVLNGASHLGAAWLARRIGLLNTMVFTHLPSSLLLAGAAVAPSFPVAVVLFLLREGLVEMDVPTRQSYVTAVVRPEERTAAAGATTLVRNAGWALAPSAAGPLMAVGLSLPLFVGAGLKIAYDVALYAAFRRVRPPEEGGETERTP